MNEERSLTFKGENMNLCKVLLGDSNDLYKKLLNDRFPMFVYLIKDSNCSVKKEN